MKTFKEYKQLDLASIHKQILKDWRKNDVFAKSIKIREGEPTFTFYEGPLLQTECPEFTM